MNKLLIITGVTISLLIIINGVEDTIEKDCKDKGGVLVEDGVRYIYVKIGDFPVHSTVPNYKCEIKEESRE